ncbi:MAG: hypothetical protein HY868_13665 [Chloroflexi bacterium]|nr:hypothetical protein [Chloroflexota bacterium]
MNNWVENSRSWLLVIGVAIFALVLAFAITRFDTEWTRPPTPQSVFVLTPVPVPFPPPNPDLTQVPPTSLPYPAPDAAPPIIQAPGIPSNIQPDPVRPRGAPANTTPTLGPQ